MHAPVLKLIYQGAGIVPYPLLLKCSMVRLKKPRSRVRFSLPLPVEKLRVIYTILIEYAVGNKVNGTRAILLNSVAILVSEILDLVSPKYFGMT